MSSSDDEYAATSGVEDVDQYSRLDLREHVLKRPENYIGSTQPQTESMWIVENGKMVNREITFVPGLYKIFDEVLVNAADNAQRDPPTKTINVVINKEEGFISVWNDGKGIPIEEIFDEKDKQSYWAPEFIFGLLLTSSNYNDEQQRTTGGRNGFGAKLANIYSTRFIVEITSSNKAGQMFKYRQVFKDNMSEKEKAHITQVKREKPSTKITFYPDFKRFDMDGFNDDILGLLYRRVWDLAGVLSGVKITLNGEKVPVRSWAEYCKLYLPEDEPIVEAKIGDRWKVAVAASSEGQFQQVSFVNSVATTRGGTHVDMVAKQITNYLCTSLSNGKKKVSVKPNMAKQFLFVFVDALIVNPEFDSQTKETLMLRPSAFGSKCELDETFLKKILKTRIPDLVRDFAQFKEAGALKKLGGKKQARVHIPKLTEANEAGGKKSQQCTLILTEGDSAKGMAVTGLSVIGQDYYGVFPLRGKMLNTRDISSAKLQKNEEIKSLMQIMALQPGQKFGPGGTSQISDLRYGSIMIMADQDQDGSHIKGLIINFIHSMWPSLIKQKGFLCEFITPIVKVTKNKTTKTFYTLPEFIAWKNENDDAKGWTVKYYKGLATSNEEETKEYFSNFRRHKIVFDYTDEGDEEKISLAFSKKRADDRKTWLADLDPSVTYIGHDKDHVTYTEFVDKELILFSNYANIRAIPSVVDGLKPGQRKILWVSLKNKIVKDIKVVQLSGRVSEQSAYHHGEDALSQTIIGMAQAFVGSNNVNLLVPSGNFGSRGKGGEDAGAPRYIYTRLEEITRYIFHKDDDELLEYLTDEGIPIEPKYYVPIIPMILVNGANGIGVGWSTTVPPYDPRVVIRNCKHMLAGEELEEMIPWWSGFQGEVEPHESGTRFTVHGKAEYISDEQIDITELPVQVWTEDYKEFIDKMTIDPEKEKKTDKQKEKEAKQKEKEAKKKEREAKKKAAAQKKAERERAKKKKKGEEYSDDDEETVEDNFLSDDTPVEKRIGKKISGYKCHHSNNTVHFEIFCNEEQMDEIKSKGLETFFRLSKSVGTTNMTLFDPDGRLKQYKSPKEILEDFYPIRLELYKDRKNALIEGLNEIMVRLSNQARFIKEFIEGTLKLMNEPRKNVLMTLKQRGYELMADDKRLPKKVAEDAIVVEGEVDEEIAEAERESDSQIAVLQKGYNYLLSMKIWTLTREKYQKLLKEVEVAEENLNVIKAKKPEDIWLEDLSALEEMYDKFEELREKRRKQNLADVDKARKKSKSKVTLSKPKKVRAKPEAKPDVKPAAKPKTKPGETREDVDAQVDENDKPAKKKVASAPEKRTKAAAKPSSPKRAAPKKAIPKGQKKLFESDDDDDVIEIDDDDVPEDAGIAKTRSPRRATQRKTAAQIQKTLQGDSDSESESESSESDSDNFEASD